jgi:hypothetical protein
MNMFSYLLTLHKEFYYFSPFTYQSTYLPIKYMMLASIDEGV